MNNTSFNAYRLTLLLLVSINLFACENKFSKMSDQELETKYLECKAMRNPQPGTAIACENINKEFNKRSKQ